MIRMRLSAAVRLSEPEIRHTASAQPTRMIRFHVRAIERPADPPSVVVFDTSYCLDPEAKTSLLNSEDLTVYKIIYSAVDEKPEMKFKCLKKLVGERGFEPPTPWSRIK
jgi:hypothetical protein